MLTGSGRFVVRVLNAADRYRIPFLASALTFDALLAAVPLFLLILAGVSSLIDRGGGEPMATSALIERFFPPHNTTPGADPFGAVEAFLVKMTIAARQLSVFAVPAFVWFSTRVFASARTALNEIYRVHLIAPRQHFVLGYLTGKLRDLFMVVVALVLFLANTILSAGLALLQARGEQVDPSLRFFVTSAGRVAGEVLAFLFLVSLFAAVYYGASRRRPPWRHTVIASLFAAVMFEAAKRLFGLYLKNAVSYQQMTVDANVGAAFLFVLWMYYSSLVFLLGGVVASEQRVVSLDGQSMP